jgi:amino acid transporter
MADSRTKSFPAPAAGALHKIGLIPFVAVLYAYCSGGPFGFEAMVSTSGPGMSLIFLLVVPWLFSVPMALASAEMATALPVEGGFYRWARAAFGDGLGFLTGWWNWTGTFLMCAAYGVQLADYIGQVRPFHHAYEHWFAAFLFLLVVAGMNVLGVRLVGNVTLILLLLALVPVAVFTWEGFAHAQHNPFQPLMPPGRPWREVYGVGLALALWIYSGYEQLSTCIEEVENPVRNFPRGLAIVVPLAMITFFLPIAAGLAALGNWQSWDTGYIVTASRLLGGSTLEVAMFAAAVVCTFVLLESTVLSATRIPFAMAEDGFMHASLARLHPRYGTPVLAILLSAGICSLLAVFKLTTLIAVYAWLRASCSVLTLLAAWRLRKKAPELPRAFRIPGGGVGMALVVLVPALLFVWALWNSDPVAVRYGPLALVVGPVAYLLLRRTETVSASS